MTEVEAEVTNSMVAAFATAPDHSTSSVDSSTSSATELPGSFPLTMTTGSLARRPNWLRKLRTSSKWMLARPTTAIFSSLPARPPRRKGK